MGIPTPLGVLYLPVALWVAVGLGLFVAFRRSTPLLVLRLSAAFLGLWALFATTTLLWVVSNGGGSAVLTLVRSPLLLFNPRFGPLWAFGALGAVVVFAVAFLLNQAVGQGFLRLLRPRPLAWPGPIPRPRVPTALLLFSSEHARAFSFTLLRLRGTVHREEIVLISEGLWRRLSPDERVAAIAHEVGHLNGLDGRYLTFLRTLARMMRWDPVLAYLASALTRREELRADLDAVRMTRDPMALARALYKASALAPGEVSPAVVGLIGRGGLRGRRDLLERIRRLVALADSSEFREGKGA